MDESSGFILEDSVGSYHANLSGKYNRVPGIIGQAIEFDGLSGYAWSQPIATQLGITGKKIPYIS